MTPPRISSAALRAAADSAAARTHPLTLHFASPELEAAFKDEYQRESIRHIRFAVAIGVFLVGSFALVDHIALPSVQEKLWLIRFGIVCPVLLIVLLITFLPGAFRYVEWVLALAVMVAGTGILGLVMVSPPNQRYYDPGLILVLMYNFVFLKLRFALATLAGWALVAVFFFTELLLHATPWPLLINNLFLWGSAVIIGMFAAYFIETLARRNYVQDKLVRRVREFGSYHLVKLLGRGGMGEVWRAEHHLLARPAAIKLIRAEKLGSVGSEADGGEARRDTLRRFAREAQATALLRSAHTIQIYDFGVSEVGVFYYVMELLDGFDLDTLVARFGPLPWPRAVHFIRQVCDSLAEAHQQGLIHRDIKPANIYVCRYGRAADFVKVLDFGLVKSHREDEPPDASATGHGQFMGTPSCMAPEQVVTDRPVDGRTDLYALGCVAYWLLTGQDVFSGSTAFEVMAHHLHTAPVPPSKRSEQPVPPELDAVILACLEKDPNRRPQTADELARELERCVGDAWLPQLAQAWWEEHVALVGADVATGEPTRVVMPSMVEPWH
jgi:hypothetical protein